MASKRKAWDEAIKQVAQKSGTKAFAAKRAEPKRETRRRLNARRWIATSDADDLQRKVEARLESLEEAVGEDDMTEEHEDEWLDEEQAESKPKRSRGRVAKKASAKSVSRAYRQRSLAQILLEEFGANGAGDVPNYISAEGASPTGAPPRRICAVTGLPGKYRDPNSNISFSKRSAQEHLKETPPPWLQLSGNVPYFETLRIIKGQTEK